MLLKFITLCSREIEQHLLDFIGVNGVFQKKINGRVR
jgi:hypothetical protein